MGWDRDKKAIIWHFNFSYENWYISIKKLLKIVHKGPINKMPADGSGNGLAPNRVKF